MITADVTITSDEAVGTFTDSFNPPSNPNLTNHGHFGILVLSGTWAATITLQVSHDDGTTWEDVPDGSWTAETYQTAVDTTNGVLYRLGCKNGDFSSGSVTCKLVK